MLSSSGFDSCVGTNAEPEKITVYNKGRSAVFERGTEKYETLKGNIYKMLNEKSTNNILMLAIVNGDISEFKQQLNVEFLYSIPAEFTYPSGSKQRITKFIIVPAAQSHTVITAPSDKGLYASGLFMVRMDSSYEELLLKYAP